MKKQTFTKQDRADLKRLAAQIENKRQKATRTEQAKAPEQDGQAEEKLGRGLPQEWDGRQ